MVVSIGMFMAPFDASIVAVAFPTMGAALHLSYSYALWAQAAYLLVTCVLLIPAGRVADSRGPVLVSGGSEPPSRSLRTVRDNLSSYGSRRPALR